MMPGMGVGEVVGFLLGAKVGVVEGINVGLVVGTLVGVVGANVGVLDGMFVGIRVGCGMVGLRVGRSVGVALGSGVGFVVGTGVVGAFVGPVGEFVGASVGTVGEDVGRVGPREGAVLGTPVGRNVGDVGASVMRVGVRVGAAEHEADVMSVKHLASPSSHRQFLLRVHTSEQLIVAQSHACLHLASAKRPQLFFEMPSAHVRGQPLVPSHTTGQPRFLLVQAVFLDINSGDISGSPPTARATGTG